VKRSYIILQYNTRYCYASCHRALYKYTHRLYIHIYFGKLAVGWWRYRGRGLTFVEHACDHYNNTLSTCFYILYCTASDAHTQYKNAEWKTTHIIARVYIFYNIRCDVLVSPQYSAPCRRANIVLTRLRQCFSCIISLLLFYARPAVSIVIAINIYLYRYIGIKYTNYKKNTYYMQLGIIIIFLHICYTHRIMCINIKKFTAGNEIE